MRLRDRAAAIAFNRSLPCRADLTDVDDEGATTLAAFRLREGRGRTLRPGRGGGRGAPGCASLIEDGRSASGGSCPEAPAARRARSPSG